MGQLAALFVRERELDSAFGSRLSTGADIVAGGVLRMENCCSEPPLIERLEHETQEQSESVAYRSELPADRTQRPDGPFS